VGGWLHIVMVYPASARTQSSILVLTRSDSATLIAANKLPLHRTANQTFLCVVGRKYGYVKYASGESARQAVDLLHGQMICGNRIKVMIAEKPRYPMDSHSSDKRKYPGDYGVDDDMDQSNKRAA